MGKTTKIAKYFCSFLYSDSSNSVREILREGKKKGHSLTIEYNDFQYNIRSITIWLFIRWYAVYPFRGLYSLREIAAKWRRFSVHRLRLSGSLVPHSIDIICPGQSSVKTPGITTTIWRFNNASSREKEGGGESSIWIYLTIPIFRVAAALGRSQVIM